MKRALASIAMMTAAISAQAETLGAVNSAWSLVKDHQIIIDVFDDPMVNGVTCYISRAKTGGVLGAVGLAEDKADASVACRQISEISFKGPIPRQEDVFTQKTSPLFKQLHVIRVVDQGRKTLVYMVYSDRLIDGSPKNSVTAVPVGVAIPMK